VDFHIERIGRWSTRVALAELAPWWRTWWPEADVERLAADVLARLDRAATTWELADLQPLAGGAVSLVCAAMRDGRSVVVKVSPRGHGEDEELRSEARTLAHWRPTGAAVALLDRSDNDLTLLMERLQPGHTLEETGVPWEDQLAELGRTVARLHAAGPAPVGAFPIQEHAAYWRRALAGQPELGELDALLAAAPTDVMIHSDLHPGNLLRHGSSWKAIDPKGARADRHADMWALLCPQAPALPSDDDAAVLTARRWLHRYADAAGMDPARAATWARLRARAEALDTDDAEWAERLERLARALTA
jgi:streptomycin 6-kinase